MKKVSALFAIILSLSSCEQDSQNVTPQSNPTSTTIEADYAHTGEGTDYKVEGNCWSNPGPGYTYWLCGCPPATIFNQNGQYWIDTLNYVVRNPLPITMTSGSSFTFNDYTLTTQNMHVTGGSGYVLNDTLRITVNAVYTSGCLDPFVFYGKYIKQP